MERNNLAHKSLSELEAAQWLGINLETLHKLLDQHVFNTGIPRPAGILFTHADLLMLSYWCEPRKSKLISMPKRPR